MDIPSVDIDLALNLPIVITLVTCVFYGGQQLARISTAIEHLSEIVEKMENHASRLAVIEDKLKRLDK